MQVSIPLYAIGIKVGKLEEDEKNRKILFKKFN